VAQSRISDYVNGRIEPSVASFNRLMTELGMAAQFSVMPSGMERTKLRSWMLHALIASKTGQGLSDEEWSLMRRNIDYLRSVIFSELSRRSLDRWSDVAQRRDTRELRRVLRDVSDDGITMREVSPMSGFLTEEERLSVLSRLRKVAP